MREMRSPRGSSQQCFARDGSLKSIRQSLGLCVFALLLSAAPSLTIAASASSFGSQTQAALTAFQAAWQRVADGQRDEPDPVTLKQLAIYPYLVAARLSRDLTGSNAADADARVGAFLKAHAGEPVTRRLARHWMQSLARRKAWPAFLVHYDASRANAALRCRRLQARIATGGTAGLVADVTKAYLTGQTRPACATAFKWLRAQDALPVTTIEKRAQLALNARNVTLARYLAKRLPSTAAGRVKRWAALIADPQRELEAAIHHPHRKIPQKALQAGFSRLVRKDVDAAAGIYPKLLKARHLHGSAARPFTRLLALGLAWDRRPRALHYFEQLGALHGDSMAEQWRIRAALWDGDWQHARDWIQALPAKLRHQPRWRYWLGRSEEMLGDTASAQKIYDRVTRGAGYYALLASWRLNRGYAPQPTALANNPKLRAVLAGQAGVVRAHQLFEVDLLSRANVEWRHALGRATPDERLQAVRLAHGWGWYVQAVATASRHGVYRAYKLLYPLPYGNSVKAAATKSALPEDWIYAVLRQESLYNARAVSRSGALGLMQLMPATARAVARRNQLPTPHGKDDLFDARANVELGATHLRELVDRENGAFIVALAGYNAGVHAAEHWLPKKPLAADVWIENIPYTETRRYIQHILWHVAVFGWERSGKPQNISALLAPVGPGAETGAEG